jgi:hypothetical protein
LHGMIFFHQGHFRRPRLAHTVVWPSRSKSRLANARM